MWLVVGLGKAPGSKYERNRHNIGFRVVDELARRHQLPALEAEQARRRGDDRHRWRARRPRCSKLSMEFMNLSGFAVQRTAAVS